MLLRHKQIGKHLLFLGNSDESEQEPICSWVTMILLVKLTNRLHDKKDNFSTLKSIQVTPCFPIVSVL
jgi:hypothetical protein